jgi:Threonine synthase
MNFVSHVECTICGAKHDAKRLLTVCEKCGQMLAVRYDLPRVASSVTRNALRERAPGMYRFRELTPLDNEEQPVTLGEGGTPLLELPVTVLQLLVLAGDLAQLVLQPLDAHLEVGILGQDRKNNGLRSDGEHRGGGHGAANHMKSG